MPRLQGSVFTGCGFSLRPRAVGTLAPTRVVRFTSSQPRGVVYGFLGFRATAHRAVTRLDGPYVLNTLDKVFHSGGVILVERVSRSSFRCLVSGPAGVYTGLSTRDLVRTPIDCDPL